jgi:type II secretory pathway pseudopilin PulG
VNNSAVTFIELLLVIIIIGILLGVSMPNLRITLDNFALENFVKDIYSFSLYLQSSAISQARPHCLNIDQGEGVIRDSYKSYKIPAGVEVLLEPADKNKICFYPDGAADKASIKFTNRQRKELSLVIQGGWGGIKMP